MLDVIQLTGEPGTCSIFRVYETCYPFFAPNDSGSEPVRFLIIAAVNYNKNGEMRDWSAYKGCADQTIKRPMIDQAIAEHGDKLSEREVKFFLHGQPKLTKLLLHYRE